MGWTPDKRQGSSTSAAADHVQRLLEEKKRKVAEAHSRRVQNNMYNSSSSPVPKEESGLNMAAHPLLLDTTSTPREQSKKDRYKPMLPKFSTVKANARNAPSPSASVAPTRSSTGTPKPVATNPYLNVENSATQDGDFASQPKDRATNRQFRFNQKGKYVHIADKQRQENQLEELRKRIAEKAEKAGMSGDAVTGGPGGGIKRPPPPAAEWWDASLLPGQNYRDIDSLGIEGLSVLLETQANSPITSLIQHPIAIPPPGNLAGGGETKVMLTSREQKKKRKLERKQAQQDKRDRVKMGLLPPDPPKVRLGNLMKVLTSSAVADPTKVEARVRREVAQRKHVHDKMNTERKLTDEQKAEKLNNKMERAEKKEGVQGCVYRIKVLSDPSHQFKVRKNAEQHGLSGICIFNPNFSLVYVEGRFQWTTAARARDEPELALNPDDPPGSSAVQKTEEERAKELQNNRCDLIWEGQIRERAFVGFRARNCPTDGTAREVLGEKMRGYWDMARNFREEDLE
ncbi:small nuclear ribonucleoprotein hPrp3 [Flagelloscypha sp. PMI_526]|nr:small nuclear ribonucleoprotein hPrp3 [Flagelloscypha sp. PMI_526]